MYVVKKNHKSSRFMIESGDVFPQKVMQVPKSCEMMQSWHTDLVKYENLTSLSRRNRKILYFTTNYKNNLVKFVNTPPV